MRLNLQFSSRQVGSRQNCRLPIANLPTAYYTVVLSFQTIEICEDGA